MTNAPADPPTGQPGTVYLIHLAKPYKHARHYIGWSDNLPHRMTLHERGCGSPLLKAASAAGIAWSVVRTWEQADRHFERRLKNRKEAPTLCPVCHGGPHPPTHDG
jgi:predicted GIY-YIG superfamily endonuclease